jgi:hypothetical protein
MREDAAPEVSAQLLLDVARQALAVLFAKRRQEGLEVLAHHGVEHCLLRLAARVGVRPHALQVGGTAARGREKDAGTAATPRERWATPGMPGFPRGFAHCTLVAPGGAMAESGGRHPAPAPYPLRSTRAP